MMQFANWRKCGSQSSSSATGDAAARSSEAAERLVSGAQPLRARAPRRRGQRLAVGPDDGGGRSRLRRRQRGQRGGSRAAAEGRSADFPRRAASTAERRASGPTAGARRAARVRQSSWRTPRPTSHISRILINGAGVVRSPGR